MTPTQPTHPTTEVSEAMVERAEAAVYKRHERGFLMKPLIDPIDMRKALEAALSPRDGVPGMVQCGWAYQDARWDADRWHVCGFDSKPREHEGRLVRPVYVPLSTASSSGARK